MIWFLVAIGVAFAVLYLGIISPPTTGAFIDIPKTALPYFEKIGDPFVIIFWFFIAVLALFALSLAMRGH